MGIHKVWAISSTRARNQIKSATTAGKLSEFRITRGRHQVGQQKEIRDRLHRNRNGALPGLK